MHIRMYSFTYFATFLDLEPTCSQDFEIILHGSSEIALENKDNINNNTPYFHETIFTHKKQQKKHKESRQQYSLVSLCRSGGASY